MIGVVMPAYDEERHLGALLDSMPAQVLGHDVFVVVVDDGSTDSTAEIARAKGAEVVELGTNQGKGEALRVGMKALTAHDPTVSVWMDADGQHLASSLPDLAEGVLSGSSDLVVGSRYLVHQHDQKAPLNRRLVRMTCIGMIRFVGRCRVTDPFSGFRAFSRDATEALELVGDGYEAELESCFSVRRAGLRVSEVPIPRIYGPNMSKMSYGTGALRGRFRVLAGYGRAMYRGWKAA